MTPKNVLITGTNGMIGNEILQLCLHSKDVKSIISITRKKIDSESPKLQQIVHSDLLHLDNISHEFKKIDVVFYCLGAYTGTVSTEELFKITVDITRSFADSIVKQNPSVDFCFLSGQGADNSETSKIPFAKAKGMAENHLLKSGLKNVFLFRPGYIYPVIKRREPNMMYRIFRSVYPFVSLIYPNIGLDSKTLAKAMFKAGLTETGRRIFENKEIKKYAKDGK
jgi:nucleoside-diphosphate-sugar epimerase